MPYLFASFAVICAAAFVVIIIALEKRRVAKLRAELAALRAAHEI